jgi:hypothetical protein
VSLPFHHSVTQEYLRAWGHAPKFKAIPGFIRYPNGSVVPKENIPIRRTGGEFGLYGFTNVDPHTANAVERDFITPHVDHPGHAVLTKLRAGTCELNAQERWDFAVFLNSLALRTPKQVEKIKRMGPEVLRVELERDPERYESMRKPGMPATAAEFCNIIAPKLAENFGMFSFSATVLSQNLVEPIYKMHWMVMLTPPGVTLLTSDNPMWAPALPADLKCLLVLPISPGALFIATHTENISLIRSERPEVIAELSNRSQCMGAQRTVYGRSTLEFARTYMSEINRSS